MMKDNKPFFPKVCSFISRPFEEDPIGLLLFLFLSSGINIVVSSGDNIKYGLYILLFASCQFYVFFLILTYSKKIYRVAKPIVAIALLFYFSVSFFCYSKFKCSLSPDITSLILATNKQEAKELISVYFGFSDILLFIVISGLTYFVYSCSCRFHLRLPSLLQRCFAVFFLVLVLGIARNYTIIPKYWQSFWTVQFDELTDLSQHYTHPEIFFSEEELPDRVVVIIGESFTKSHSSLYGYPIDTNPRLGAMLNDSALFVFSQVVSPAVITIPSFKYILNTHLTSDPDSIRWYNTTTIIELLKTMGYTTHWMSNQAKAGMYDNVASAFAKICDSYQFVHDSGKAYNYDETLLELDVPKGQKQAIFYHLMGQHVAFPCRYPSHYDVFSDTIYSSFPDYEIEPRRMYDNATIYNDYVCSEIIRKYQDNDAMVFYFPDHGLDFFDVDGYHGHGRMEVPESEIAAKKIPFMVFLSSESKRKHPELIKRVMEKQDEPLCTDAFTDLVMSLLNVQVYGL